LANVRDTDPLGVSPMFAGGVGVVLVNVTLCVAANVQVTEPPGAIVTVEGLNVLLVVASTLAVEGLGPACDTVTVTWLDWTPSAVARMVEEPAATPVAVVGTPDAGAARLGAMTVDASPALDDLMHAVNGLR
jgi:hypothetical protein